jgi:PIN domain nuclease of toxin-antitoxin system
VRYLVDTKVFLWMQAEPSRLGPQAAEVLTHERNDVYLSAASAWEIALKYRLGRVVLPDKPARYVPERMAASQILHLPIDASHALGAAELDDHHTDPVDRLLVSQAKLERMRIVSADPSLGDYDVEVIDATT